MAKKGRISSKAKQAESQHKKEAFRQESLAQEEKARVQREQEEQKRREKEKKQEIQGLFAKVENRMSVEAPRKKSTAKAAGLKSTIILEQGKILVTSFGKGNTAVPQVEVTFQKNGVDVVAHTIKQVCGEEAAALKVTPQEKQLQVDGRANISAMADNPIYRCNGTKYQASTNQILSVTNYIQPSTDLIGAKSALEKRYFHTDTAFEDNIHIQIIHAIQDIEKVVSVYATEIVYTLNNILGKEEKGHPVDLVGMMSLDKTYKQFQSKALIKDFEELLKKKQLLYFGDIIPQAKRNKSGKAELTDEEKNKAYLILATLGTIRQATTHGDERNRGTLFTVGKENACHREAIGLLRQQYDQRVEQLNHSFATHAFKDVTIICRVLQILSDKEKEQIIREYYDFIIRKTYKTFGFSVKALREILGAMEEFQWMNDEKYDSVRHKLNHIVDFLIVRYFSEHESEAAYFVERLRSCGVNSKKISAEDRNFEKRSLYAMQALRMKAVLKHWLGKILQDNLQGDSIQQLKSYDPKLPENKIWKSALSDTQLQSSGNTFSAMLYLMTRFLDGKEINELLTKTANRFDNIASFLDIADRFGVFLSFREEYKIFEKSKEIAEEIRVINSFARMSEDMGNVRRALMRDAAVLLGLSMEEASDAYLDQIMNGDLCRDTGHEFRNFIINNVIESSRFQYLVRYSNPKNVRKLAEIITQKGNPVLHFVLARIPDAQLVRYYESCTGETDGNQKKIPELIDILTDIIRKVNFKEYETIRNANRISAEERIRKERTKNILGLYLTVLFQLLKNLNHVNARYIIAFQRLEGDSSALLQDWMKCGDENLAEESKKCYQLLTKGNGISKGMGMIDFTRLFYFRSENVRYKKRVKQYIQQNMENACVWSVVSFRNNVAHLNVIRDAAEYIEGIREVHSYFELYHYMMQKRLMKEYEYEKNDQNQEEKLLPADKTISYFSKMQKYGTYCKDYVKAINVPFAYNLPRYKSLSVNELFDKNNYLPDQAAAWDKCDE